MVLMTAIAFSIRPVAPSPSCVYRHILCHQSRAMAFSIRRVAPSPRCVYRHVLCHQSAAMAFSIRPVAPLPSCVYRHILCHQLTAMAFSIRQLAPSPRCVYRHILCHRAAQHRWILVEIRSPDPKFFFVRIDPLPQDFTPRASLGTRLALHAHKIGRKPMAIATAAAPSMV